MFGKIYIGNSKIGKNLFLKGNKFRISVPFTFEIVVQNNHFEICTYIIGICIKIVEKGHYKYKYVHKACNGINSIGSF